jgi:predicted phage baseplate assembly protein
MPIPAPHIDNRRFQDIVDEAKRLIPQYCPEWTDHNVSDPGIALVELFAWMTESLLYRANQVPEKTYIRFLELLGTRLDPPRAAHAPLTFMLSAPQEADYTIQKGIQAATLRTETTPAIVFTTEADLTIRPPVVKAVFTHRAALGKDGWTPHDLNRLGREQSIILFPNPPAPGDAFLIAFERDHSHHVLGLELGCKPAGGAGSVEMSPPIQWEAWQGEVARWVPCSMKDTTRGFNQDGEMIVRLPAMMSGEFADLEAFWLRCRVIEHDGRGYEVSPELERVFRVQSRGGTVNARHAIAITNEVLGKSDGTPGQRFKLLNSPILARDPETDVLVVETPDGPEQSWHEVDDFGDTGIGDFCYTLDSGDGTLTLAPALLQPDGGMHHFGAVPPKGSVLRFKRYLIGGGMVGNVPAGNISVLTSSSPTIAEVTNYEPALGGRDAQTVDDAKMRAGHRLRSSARAVTAGDFEFHTMQVAGVARARCLAPGEQPADAGAIRPGQVFVIVLPEVQTPDKPLPEQLALSPQLRTAILDYLHARCVLGVGVEVRAPELIWISVKADLRVPIDSHPLVRREVQRRAEAELYEFLNPFKGGMQRKGWPFGRDLYLSEVYGLLQRIPSVEFIESVRMEIVDPAMTASKPAPPRVQVGSHSLVCSFQHVINVTQADE